MQNSMTEEELLKLARAVADAWNIQERNPKNLRLAREKIYILWPTLHRAVEKLATALKK